MRWLHPGRWSWQRWLLTSAVSLVVLAVGVVLVYVYVIEGSPPKKLAIQTTNDTGAAAGPAAPVEGTWKVSSGSKVGYRVKEVLFGLNATAVGRTSDVSGQMVINGTQVAAASFTAQMATVTSDQGNRDNQFRGRIMDVQDFPTATFVLSSPLSLSPLPATGKIAAYSMSGKLTLRGVTKAVNIDLSARRAGSTIAVNGEIPINFPDYSIPNPTSGPASVGDHGTLEVLLVFTKGI